MGSGREKELSEGIGRERKKEIGEGVWAGRRSLVKGSGSEKELVKPT